MNENPNNNKPKLLELIVGRLKGDALDLGSSIKDGASRLYSMIPGQYRIGALEKVGIDMETLFGRDSRDVTGALARVGIDTERLFGQYPTDGNYR